ncbi:MAG: helix-turn-helix domain-containing protein [Desulfobulbaceae bacterium]|jgi:hypothetical protein
MANPHLGSDFDEFLREENIHEEVTAAALKRVIAWQLSKAMKARHMTKTEMASRMHTSRAVVNRLLDEDDTVSLWRPCPSESGHRSTSQDRIFLQRRNRV